MSNKAKDVTNHTGVPCFGGPLDGEIVDVQAGEMQPFDYEIMYVPMANKLHRIVFVHAKMPLERLDYNVLREAAQYWLTGELNGDWEK